MELEDEFLMVPENQCECEEKTSYRLVDMGDLEEYEAPYSLKALFCNECNKIKGTIFL